MCENYDCMTYQKGMEELDSGLLERVLTESAAYKPSEFTPDDVTAALRADPRGPRDFAALLSPAADGCMEDMAAAAKEETARRFGNSIQLFTPLYIANYCENHCVYCGFNCRSGIGRGKLSEDDIARELDAIAATGLDEILLLTGEARAQSDVEYIGRAVRQATAVFHAVGVEIYPLNTGEYACLRECGADYVSVYQETYDLSVYAAAHPKGPKRCFPYRFHAQERALLAGMRGVSFGVLLGLGDFRRDAFSAGLHAYYLQKKVPHAEVSFSVPRIRAFQNHAESGVHGVGERQLLQVMLAYRLFMPFAGLTISTRERPGFRDHAAGLCATKMSAGVSVGVGGHDAEPKGGEQFEIADRRSAAEIHEMLRSRGLQPVYSDYSGLAEQPKKTFSAAPI